MATQFFKRSSWYWERCDATRQIQGLVQDDANTEVHGREEGEDEENLQESRKDNCMGVAVLLGWMFSERRHHTPFTRLYNSLGFDCLVCQFHPLNLFFPRMATTMAMSVLDELLKELEKYPRPVVFVTFSGGHKTCLYKVIQILFGQHKDINFSKDKFKVVAESMSGLIFDSSPVEFESSIGAKVLSQQVLTYETGKSIPLISHGAHAVGRGLDYLFYRQFEHQKEEMWHALYSCVKVGPILVFCSELDELAPFETIQIFAANIRRLGGKINVVAWKDSKHVGHFRRYPDQYTKEVRSLLLDAISTFSHRKHQSSKWTDLPEAIVAEIYQMSRLPHLHVKMGSVAENVTDDGESAVLPKVDAGSEASQKHVSRSRL